MKKKLVTDVIWNVLALVIFNGILQCIVYPWLNRNLGADKFGEILYILAIISVFAPAVGLANNNTRIVEDRDRETYNGDFIISMFTQILFSVILCMLIIFPLCENSLDRLLSILILIGMSFRYYSDVEFRLTLCYKKYFSYYLFISLGYVIGTWLGINIRCWMVGILLGEIAGTAILLFRGKIYQGCSISKNWKTICKKVWALFGAYVIYNAVLNLDRVLLQNLMESADVTVYYVATLLGKTVALLVGPLNGIIIGYLSKNNVAITLKRYIQITGAILVTGAIIFVCLLFLTPIFVNLMYPDIVESVLEISTLGNLAQIFGFAASLLLTILLTFCNTKWQLLIQLICGILFVVFGYIGVQDSMLNGFSVACVWVNVLRFGMTVMIGCVLLRAKKKEMRER